MAARETEPLAADRIDTRRSGDVPMGALTLRAPAALRPRRATRVRLVDNGRPAGTPPSSNRRRRAFALQALVVAVVSGALATDLSLVYRGTKFTACVDGLAQGLAAAVAVVLCLVRAQRERSRMRAAWRSLSIAALAAGFGQAVWTWDAFVHWPQMPVRSPATIGLLAAMPFAVTGIVLLIVAPSVFITRVRHTLDWMIVAASLLTLSWVPVLHQFFADDHPTTLDRALPVAGALAALVVASVAICALSCASRRRQATAALITIGALALAVARVGLLHTAMEAGPHAVPVTDTGFVLAFGLLSLAALLPVRRLVAASPGSTELANLSLWQAAVPYALFAAATGVDAASYARHGSLDLVVVTVAIVLLGAMLLRQLLIVVENYRLTSHLEAAIATMRSEEAELTRLAMHDPLTGIANRVLFTERLRAALALAAAGERRVAVVFCDLDGFKDVNDSLGHSAGDAMLIGVAERLLTCVRPEDTVARLGGDEFAIVLEDLADLSDGTRVAARIIETMREPLTVGNDRFLLHASIGVALASEGSYDVEGLLRDADIALYAAKNSGGNRYCLFDSVMGTAYLDRLRLEADLAVALEAGELFLEYQPIVDLGRGVTIGVEALLRWQHPTRGLLQPASFLAAAERSGSITTIGTWVLEESLRQLKHWQDHFALAPDFSVAINLSVRQLEAGDLVSIVQRAIAESGVSPTAVRLELTETALIDRAESSIDLLHALRRLGVHLEIDDFGTGYSSLDYLRRLPLDILKIDQSFISGLGSDSNDNLIVETVINLAHALGMTVVAEGVETPAQLERLKTLGCDHGQGFLFSASLTAAAADAWLRGAASIMRP